MAYKISELHYKQLTSGRPKYSLSIRRLSRVNFDPEIYSIIRYHYIDHLCMVLLNH
ncbi:hypothetical protein T12_7207 [Trichinella patagoniensis]|uniref:Uncharacterized protein n=1 Tax=Trichinella patagoniensis TaxID=990121 RepID=A0A0V0YQP7_9BILA|nr:hypothetical protein T12_7207 [Trichinella patagoniensis]